MNFSCIVRIFTAQQYRLHKGSGFRISAIHFTGFCITRDDFSLMLQVGKLVAHIFALVLPGQGPQLCGFKRRMAGLNL